MTATAYRIVSSVWLLLGIWGLLRAWRYYDLNGPGASKAVRNGFYVGLMIQLAMIAWTWLL